MSVEARWVAFRNRLLANPAFHRFAARFPLFKPIAQAEAHRLFDLTAGFVYSQVLGAAVELGLLEILAEGPQPAENLGLQLGLAEAPLRAFLRATAGLELTACLRDGRIALGAQGAALLGDPGLKRMISHHRKFYRDLDDTVALLRRGGGGGEVQSYWAYARSTDPSGAKSAEVADYSQLMAETAISFADDVLDVWPLNTYRKLMDVGGGEGAFLSVVARRVPSLKLALFDLPAVVERAEARLAAIGLQDRVERVGGSFSAEALPTGADLISLIRIVHDHDDSVVLALFRATYAALPKGGEILIAEPMAGIAGAGRLTEVYFSLYLLAMGHGRTRSASEIGAMLKAAGFRRIRVRKTASLLPFGVMVAARDN